jgi:hypothetical protein
LRQAYREGQKRLQGWTQPGNERVLTDYDEDDDIPRDYFEEVNSMDNKYEEEGYSDVDEGYPIAAQEVIKRAKLLRSVYAD